MKNKLRYLLVMLLAIQMVATDQAHAYIDPGSGSTMFQLLIAGLVGAGWTIKSYWAQIVLFFRRKKSEKR